MTPVKISLLIISRKFVLTDESVQACLRLEGEGVDFEVIIAEGDNPSLQRNALAQKAEGDYLLFLDSDSIPDKKILSYYKDVLINYPETLIVGGPSILRINDVPLERMSNTFFCSIFGLGPFRSRYISFGDVRLASERELILSNLLVNKRFFLENGGFQKNLYPGEENEFLKRVQKRNPKNIVKYHPLASVSRKPRDTIWKFIAQMLSYGHGRAKHLNLKSNLSDALFLIPMFFSLYIVFLILGYSFLDYSFWFYPLILHFLMGGCAYLAFQRAQFKYADLVLVSLFYMLGHFFYGVGILEGGLKQTLFRKIYHKERELSYLKISHIKKFSA